MYVCEQHERMYYRPRVQTSTEMWLNTEGKKRRYPIPLTLPSDPQPHGVVSNPNTRDPGPRSRQCIALFTVAVHTHTHTHPGIQAGGWCSSDSSTMNMRVTYHHAVWSLPRRLPFSQRRHTHFAVSTSPSTPVPRLFSILAGHYYLKQFPFRSLANHMWVTSHLQQSPMIVYSST